MEFKTLGKSNLLVSDIGFGAWGIGGLGWGNDVTDEASNQALKRALDLGVNFYDTCDAYGDGHSEMLLGSFFKHNRHDVVIATKGGTNYRVPERSKNFNKDYIQFCLDESLTRLQTDYVDLYLLHVPTVEWQKNTDIYDTLSSLKASGKTRAVGIAMWGAEAALYALEHDTNNVLDAIECPMSILNKTSDDVVKLASQNNIGVFNSEPLSGGILTGKYKKDTKFPDNDHRKNFWTPARFEEIEDSMELIRSYAKNYDSMAQLALAYNICFPSVSAVIPGAKTAKQVEANVSASGIKLPDDVMTALMNLKGYCF